MSQVNYPYKETSDIFDGVINAQITHRDEQYPQLSQILNIQGNDGVIRAISFFQLRTLVDVLLKDSAMVANIPPANYLINQWLLQDLANMGDCGYVITKYQVFVDHKERTAKFTGTLTHRKTIPNNEDYEEGFKATEKVFEYLLSDFGIFHQIAFSQTIAAMDPQFEFIDRTFDHSYLLERDGGRARVVDALDLAEGKAR